MPTKINFGTIRINQSINQSKKEEEEEEEEEEEGVV
jgi:hypothetical protein